MLGGNAQEHAGGSSGLAAPLLPVAQRCRADAKSGGKGSLAQAQFGADGGDGIWIDVVHARCSPLVAAQVRAGFADTLEEILKIGFFHGLRVNEQEGLAAIAAIDAEVADIGRDDFCPRKSLGEPEHAAVGHVHRWPVFRDGGANRVGFIGKHWFDQHPTLSRQCEHEINGALGVGEEVARLGQHDLAGGGRFAEGIQHLPRPDVMLIRRVGERNQRTSIEDVARTSHARNLRAGKGRLVRS